MRIFPSRLSASLVLLGTLSLILIGYQNCGMTRYARTGSSASPEDPGTQCTGNCGPVAAIAVQATNYRNQVIGTNGNTCPGLTAEDIQQGHHRQITLGMTAANFTPIEFQCLRLEPVQDPADPGYVNCAQITTLDRNGTSQCTYETPVDGNAQLARLVCTGLPDTVAGDPDQDTYSVEIVGVGQLSDGTRFRTLPQRPVFQISNCSGTPDPPWFEVLGVTNERWQDPVLDDDGLSQIEMDVDRHFWISISKPQAPQVRVEMRDSLDGTTAFCASRTFDIPPWAGTNYEIDFECDKDLLVGSKYYFHLFAVRGETETPASNSPHGVHIQGGTPICAPPQFLSDLSLVYDTEVVCITTPCNFLKVEYTEPMDVAIRQISVQSQDCNNNVPFYVSASDIAADKGKVTARFAINCGSQNFTIPGTTVNAVGSPGGQCSVYSGSRTYPHTMPPDSDPPQ